MNNKGFTLVEVLAVIVILAILGAIMVPSVTNVLQQNKVRNYANLKKSILGACRIYVNDREDDLLAQLISSERSCDDGTDSTYVYSDSDMTISLDDLVKYGELSNDIINPIDGKHINKENTKVQISFSCKTRKFTCGEIVGIE